MIVKLTVPVTNYMGDGVHMQEYYFDPISNYYLTKNVVVEYLRYLHKCNFGHIEYIGTDGEAAQIIESMEDGDWVFVDFNVVYKCRFIHHPKFGEQPITWQVINPVKFDQVR